MKPIVGITGDVKTDPDLAVRLKLNYVDAVREAGGVPVVLAPIDDEDLDALLARVDAVVMTGGGDVDLRTRGAALHATAELMHPRRQAFDLALAKRLLAAKQPVLGICLGMQEIAVAAGAAMHQHLPDAGFAELLNHRSSHDVEVAPGSRLGEALGSPHAWIVSHHHQGVAECPKGFRIAAKSPDGVLEAIEMEGDRFVIGVQWHPERSPEKPESKRLFRALVEAAKRR